jgi:hypothetical protein
VIKDTRIPPKGYRPPRGHEMVGADYSGGENGALRHWDDARYVFTIPATLRGPVMLRVRARYQTTTRHYVEFLASENHTDDRGRELLRLYNATGRSAPVDMAQATSMITVTGTTLQNDGGVIVPVHAEGGWACNATANSSRRSSSGLFVSLVLMGVAAVRRRARPRK